MAATARRPLGISARRTAIDLAQDDRLEGRHRRAPEQRRRRPAEEGQGQDRRTAGRSSATARRSRSRPRPARRSIRAEKVVIATGSASGRAAVPAVRRHRDLVDRGAGAAGSAGAASSSSAAGYIGLELGTAFAKLGREGHGRRSAAAHPAAIRRRADAAGREAACRARRRGADRRQGARVLTPKSGRACSSRQPTARSDELAADKILVTVGRKPADRGLGPRGNRPRHGRPLHPHRRPVPHLDARRLRHRRRDRRADAGASRDGAGRDGGRDRRRPEAQPGTRAASRPSASPIPEIVRAGLSPDEAQGCRPRDQDRRCSRSPPMAAP